MKKKYTGYIIGGLLVIAGIWLVITYNSLVRKDENVKKQWNEVQNTYQRRLDLVTSLVSIVKGGADFEQTTLQKIAEARAKAITTTTGGEITAENYNRQSTAQAELAGATGNLLAVVEKYPDLKGAAAFRDLQTQLERTEIRISMARTDFNKAIADYNTSVRGFPVKIAAALFGFKAREGFSADAGAEKNGQIKF